jgi:hypothetical protein
LAFCKKREQEEDRENELIGKEMGGKEIEKLQSR